ncbi:MAG: protoheme IX farnesyltransferase, partial [Dehalococcoidia bacterium]|nr:protoheme IX farnesyltransferase [Dehalococcoidia bacterium]
QILLYSWLLVPVTVIFGAAADLGAIYVAVALVGGGVFLALATRLRSSDGIAGAQRLFRYSIVYLGVLFVSMAVDRLVLA